MAVSETSSPFMDRSEYDASAAMRSGDGQGFSFLDEVDALFGQSERSPDSYVSCEVTKGGISSYLSTSFDVYDPGTREYSTTSLEIEYWRANQANAEANYAVRTAIEPKSWRVPPLRRAAPIVTEYEIGYYGDQCIGDVYQSVFDEECEMTPYDYKELNRVLKLARAAQAATWRWSSL